MNRKLIFIDLDGTLLGNDGKLSPFTVETIRTVNRSNPIVLATGRPLRAVLPYYGQLELHAPVIAYNGSFIYDPKTERTIYRKTFSPSIIKSVCSLGDSLLSFMAESDTTIYCSREDKDFFHYFPTDGMNLKIGNLDQIHEDLSTLLFKTRPEDTKRLKDLIEENEGIGWRHWSDPLSSEAFFLGVDKKKAAEIVAGKLGFEKGDIIAFGDSVNDKTLLEFAKRPILMLNSKREELKALFPLSERTNEKDGVAFELRKLFPHLF